MESAETGSQQAKPAAGISRKGKIVVGVVVLAMVAGAVWITGLGPQLVRQATYVDRPPTFSGDSQKLEQTVIVPTLDSPCPPGKNVIWCSSFQLAWNEMKDKVIGAPLQVVGAEEVAARLNAAKQSASDLDPKSFYIAGGWIKDGIVGKIEKDMAARFPSHALQDFNDYDAGILAYSYLTVNVPFKHPFREATLKFGLGDAPGEGTDVEAFGVWGLLTRYDRIRQQVEILHCGQGRNTGHQVKECVIDLCRDSRPYQVVVAMVEPKSSLAETLEYVRLRVNDFKESTGYEHESQLSRVDSLRVPELVWRIDHHFRELIGKVVGNVGMPITEAMQTIEFRVDRNGAILESEARFDVAALPRVFEFNRPFLVYMQKRGAEQPFFVMWVDNDELLRRR